MMTDQLKETGMTNTETRCRDCDGYNCDNGCAYPPRDTEMQIADDVLAAAYEAMTEGGLRPIAEAIMAERERCARICDSKMYDFGCIAGTEAQDFVTLCADLAMEIRSVDK